ncbi:hypothetical protein [Selenomonas sp. AE3005]|uniref:hypothetical protein n=1 Tax=Selenomonas sp. AE3005 TaxID=1485543 RepID=UPI0025FD29C0|nr:hypothetical protein [Selenomonas sp. AE3005]
MDIVHNATQICTALGFIIIGIGGTWWYMRDKAIISSGPGVTFNLYFRYFVVFALLGGIIGRLAGTLIGHGLNLAIQYWYIVLIIVVMVGYFIKKGNTEKDQNESGNE